MYSRMYKFKNYYYKLICISKLENYFLLKLFFILLATSTLKVFKNFAKFVSIYYSILFFYFH